MTATFPFHDEMTAPEAARTLADTKRNFGMIPNLERVMANAPALLAAYSRAWDPFDTTSLTPIETRWRPVAVLSGPDGTKCGAGMLITTWHA